MATDVLNAMTGTIWVIVGWLVVAFIVALPLAAVLRHYDGRK